MLAPFEYVGSVETCLGCLDVIHAGDIVAPLCEDRSDRLLCVACWWLDGCGLPLPMWETRTQRRRMLP